MATYESQQNMIERSMKNYCGDVRSDRTQFDKDLQNMWCPSCCGPSGPTGPMGATGPMGGLMVAAPSRYGSAREDIDFRGNLKVAGVN
jgi:hypothetical protein